MIKIKEMLKDTKFWIFILIVIAFFGIFIKMDYATDTYCVFGTPASQMIQHFIKSGRFVTAASQSFLTLIHSGNEVAYLLSITLALIATGVSIYKLYKIFEEDIPYSIIAGLASILIIINVFSIELYLFLEKGILMLSVLLCVLAFEKMISFVKGENKVKSIVLAFIYMIIANFSYQGTVALFVALCCIYIVKHSKDIKSFVINNIITGICYGIPALINYLTVKFIFGNTRVSGEYNLLLSIEKIWLNTKEMITYTYKILPQYLFIGILGIVGITCIICLIMKKEEQINDENNIRRTMFAPTTKKILLILGLIYVIIATFVVTIFPQIMQSTNSIGFAPRSTYTFASLIGIIVVYTFINTKPKKLTKDILSIILIGYLVIQYASFSNIARDRYSLNYMDYNQFLQIQTIVEAYEKETGNTITKIATYKNEPQGTYPGIFISGDINLKAMCPDWSRIDYLEYYFNRTLEEVEKSEEIYNTYFKDKTWKFFDKEQVVLKDDVMHIYVY